MYKTLKPVTPLVMGPGRVNFCGWGWVRSGWVSHLWFGFEFGKFPHKMSNFSIFFLLGQKNLSGSGQKVTGSKVGQTLIYCRSKVSSGRAGSRPISTHHTVGVLNSQAKDFCFSVLSIIDF